MAKWLGKICENHTLNKKHYYWLKKAQVLLQAENIIKCNIKHNLCEIRNEKKKYMLMNTVNYVIEYK